MTFLLANPVISTPSKNKEQTEDVARKKETKEGERE